MQTDTAFIMALPYLLLALIVQVTSTYADIDIEDLATSREVLVKPVVTDETTDFHATNMDWVDMFMISDMNLHPTSSVVKMSHVTNSNKTAEEQLEDIKEMARQITLAIQNEMANLLTFAMNTGDKDIEDNNLRKRRSAETPTDSTQLIMRLLRHIKSNNEYQNIAIEKMMSAQEIADKFGIEFNPDPEVLSDLAVAANEQTKELSSILEEACTLTNVTGDTSGASACAGENSVDENTPENNTFYVYTVHYDEDDDELPPYEYVPHYTSNAQSEMNHVHYSDPHYYHNYYSNPYDTQIPSPVPNPVSHRPNFYDSVSYQPDYYSQYCPVEPISSNAMPFEVEPEPELMAEEFEETITSRVIVERGDEPGSAIVNHVTTYTMAEKSHFKTPEIEKLPEQVQYSFFLL